MTTIQREPVIWRVQCFPALGHLALHYTIERKTDRYSYVPVFIIFVDATGVFSTVWQSRVGISTALISNASERERIIDWLRE